jgi:isoamylase
VDLIVSVSSPLSLPYPLGVTVLKGAEPAVNVAVYSETADAVEFCTFDESGVETKTVLTERTGHVFHGIVDGVEIGTRYGLRVHGDWDPANGIRHNPHKLLLEPHATAITGDYTWGQAVFGHNMDEPREQDTSDSAGSTPLCIVTDPAFDWTGDVAPRTAFADSVIYEVHVKGFTQLHPDVPEDIRGTYAGLAHPAAIQHFLDLGVTAVELLPVQQFVQDSHLIEKDLRNYWGYNSIGFFAPHGDYAAAGDGGAQVAEFKSMVKALHEAGLEVILDVVYNHTAEGNHMGPTLSFKGIDNKAYYRLVEDDKSSYFDTTGTGNSLNVGHPAALGLIMDSLRYWVTEMHVDGFRFDLATTLTRQGGDAELHSAFLSLIEQDPTLASTKMIAEPWDTAGYQVGGFPADWSEWNGKFRDDVRDFWNGEAGVTSTLAQRVLGSPDVYEASRRSPMSSVNFITAHDGFTLHDLTSYEEKHNEANGEGNNDGESDNKSFNGGIEGPTDDGAVNLYRERQRRNFLATLLLSAGVPMILGGDEIGRTQGGNNNGYAQDSEISWFDWEKADKDLFAFTQELITLRHENPALRPVWFRQAPANGEDAFDDDTVQILTPDGSSFSDEDWANPEARSLAFLLWHRDEDAFVFFLNAAQHHVDFLLPPAPNGPWELAASSDPEQTSDLSKLSTAPKKPWEIASPREAKEISEASAVEEASDLNTLIVRDASFTLLRSRVAK